MDVIVNTTSKELVLNRGTLSKTILTDAGQALQDECKTKKLDDFGEVVVTKSFKLPCRAVYHGAGVEWDVPKGDKSLTV